VLDPRGLYELDPDLPAVEGGLVLVEALDGFVDAGAARRLAREHLFTDRESRVVATFDVDTLHDYRARRPAMLFVEDHWESYETPHLGVHLLTDADERPFLLLAGPEPDVQWERFVAAVGQVIEALGVRLTLGLNAIPMSVPHTRPLGVTAHASRPELIAGATSWIHTVQVPGSAGHLLEYRLGQAGRDAAGFAVHVPHYLAELAYPPAAQVLLEQVAAAGRLRLPTDELQAASERVRADIDGQVAASEEVAAVVRALEKQYDETVVSRARAQLAGTLPSADELGAELERFLAEQAKGTGSQEG